jgi:ABC-type transporter Mla maintaining outer membrane lipid asymmetry ATPase subunit MlaF
VLKLVDGVRFKAGPDLWNLGPLRVSRGTWVALIPDGRDPVVPPSGTLAWIIATMEEPLRGNVEILGHDIYRLDYVPRQRLRARIGFVHGYGGLISNRTVRENIALPPAVHWRLSAAEEDDLVNRMVNSMGLEKVADLRPHQMDGATRWRACLARSLVLDPDWLVLEGLGNWEMDRGRGRGWTQLIERHRAGQMATAICLARKNPEFEAWFEELGGVIVRYPRYQSGAARRAGR